MEAIELTLDDLSSNWIDALDDWHCALRRGARVGAPEWKRLEEVEARRVRGIRSKRDDHDQAFNKTSRRMQQA